MGVKTEHTDHNFGKLTPAAISLVHLQEGVAIPHGIPI